jgi:hypothetical protein
MKYLCLKTKLAGNARLNIYTNYGSAKLNTKKVGKEWA